MPNYCSFSARLVGPVDKVKKLTEWLQANYCYTGKNEITGEEHKYPVYLTNSDTREETPTEHHIGYRIFDFDVFDEEEYGNGEMRLDASGDCAWSVKSCMFDDGEGCYMSDKTYGAKDSRAISIVNACKELGVDFEIISSEPGCCFAEHYLVNRKGEVEIEDCFDYQEIWVEDYDTFEDFLKDNDVTEEESIVTREEFDNAIENGDSYVIKCDVDFENLPFEIG